MDQTKTWIGDILTNWTDKQIANIYFYLFFLGMGIDTNFTIRFNFDSQSCDSIKCNSMLFNLNVFLFPSSLVICKIYVKLLHLDPLLISIFNPTVTDTD